MSSIRTTTLPNGLRIVTDTMSDAESVALGVWVGVGTRHEELHENGIAHMVEHMLFKGTAKRTAQQISEVIEDAGGHINAYTGREVTAYYIHILKEHAALALDVIADMLQNATFPVDELERERQVIIQEVNMYLDTPDDLVFDLAQEAAYPGQALGAPGLGKVDILNKIDRDALFNYIRARYAPERMVVSAAGAIEHDTFVQMVASVFTNLPATNDNGHHLSYAPARYAPTPSLVEKDTEQTHLVLGFQGIKRGDPRIHAVKILSGILGGGTSSRLWQEIREKRGMVYSIYSFYDSYSDDGQFGVYAGSSPDNLPEMVPVMLDEIKKIQDSVTPQELARAKSQITASLRMGREKVMTRAEQQGRYMLGYGKPLDPQQLIREVEAVTAEDVKSVAQQIFATPLLVSAIGPLGSLMPVSGMADHLRIK